MGLKCPKLIQAFRFEISSPAMAKAMKAMKAMKAKSVKALPKGGIADALATATGHKKAECSKMLDALTELAQSEVPKGKFTIPGLVMIKTKKKAATKACTKLIFGKMQKVKARPAKTIVKAYCVKALKDSI